MSVELVTGYTGAPHVSSIQDGELYAGIIGIEEYVLVNGNMFEALITDTNTITIYDGCLVMQGRHIIMNPGTSEQIVIESASQGIQRIDAIVMRYELMNDGKEKANLAIVKGTPFTGDSNTSPPAANLPVLTTGALRQGAAENEMLLYYTRMDGVNLNSVESKMKTVYPLAAIINNLTTTAADRPLSAAMGKKLQDEKLAKANLANNLTTTAAGYALDARQALIILDTMRGYGSTVSRHGVGHIYQEDTGQTESLFTACIIFPVPYPLDSTPPASKVTISSYAITGVTVANTQS
ncbi:MAG: hypothetical protein ACK5MN_12270, partial [Lachnospiraceae bacterium]